MQQGEKSRLALQLLFLGKHLGYLMERRLASQGLNRTHAMVLLTLSRRPGLKALDLCGPARVEPANITRTLQSLERMGFLERRPHPTDRRASLFYLTKAGESQARRLSAEVDKLSTELFQDVDPKALSHLEELLDTLRGAVRRQLATISPRSLAAGHQLSASDPAETVGEGEGRD